MTKQTEIFEKNKLKSFLKIMITTLIILTLFLLVRTIIEDENSIARISNSVGIFGPIVLILLISLGILLSPIPSIVLIMTAGYIYGCWLGALYSYIGHLIASISVFAIVKRFKITNKNKKYTYYSSLIKKNQNFLYPLYIIPFIPISVLSIISATSKISWKKFLEIISISFVPVVLFFSFFGTRLNNKNLYEIGALIVIMIIGLIVVFRIIRNKSQESKL